MFWRKGKTRDVKNALLNLQAYLSYIPSFDKKRDLSIKIVTGAIADLETVRREIPIRAENYKKRALIDARFDAEIDKLATDELRILTKLEKDLALWGSMAASTEREEELAAVALALVNEGKEIRYRDDVFRKTVEGFEVGTLKRRSATETAAAPAEKTSDGVPFRNIAQVVRELGGWLVSSSTHVVSILFPNASRPVPLSKDARSARLAQQIRDQLARWLPTHKIPSTSELVSSFRVGTLRVPV